MLKNDYTYLSRADIKYIYQTIKGSTKGITAFLRDAEKVSSRTRKNSIIYKDEEKLYEVLEKHLSNELKTLGIDCFGRLMQYLPD